MNNNHQNMLTLNSNDGYPYSEEIIGQYVMELPVFDDKKLNSAPNQPRKKKILKPLRTHTLSATRRRQCISNTPYQTTYTSHNSIRPNLNNLLSNDYILRIKQLENELAESRMKRRDLIAENRVLKEMGKRQESALSMYEGNKAKLPQMIKSHEEDVRMLQSQIRQMKISNKEMENRYKSQSNELQILQKKYKHLLSLSKNKQLSKREKLSDQLEEAQNTIAQQNNKIQNLEKHLELQNKTHRHHINSENIKVKDLQLEISRMKDENKNLESSLEKLKNSNYSQRHISSRGITEHSISITPRAIKPIPTNHEQGDVIEASLYTTNGSIPFKPESSHEEYEDDTSIKSLQMDSIMQAKSNAIKKFRTRINKKLNSSNVSSRSIPWLNQSQANLAKENKNKQELPNIENDNFENKDEHIIVGALRSIQKSTMSRTQKDLLLAKLNQVSENDNSYDSYYKSNSLKQSVDKIYSPLVSTSVNSESSSSD